MGVKRKCRELNQAKNKFVKWLKDNEADNIEIFIGEDVDDEWDYYRDVSGFVGNKLIVVRFMMWNSKIKIEYSNEDYSYRDMSIEEFYELLAI